MNLLFTLQNVTELSKQVWTSALDSKALRLFGDMPQKVNGPNVVIVRNAQFNRSGELRFDPGTATLLNIGDIQLTVLIEGGSSAATRDADEIIAFPMSGASVQNTTGGDESFLSELSMVPSEVRQCGIEILRAVRIQSRGRLLTTKTGKFVESPDNFWTVKVQPRDESLAITVRGVPKGFVSKTFNVSDDRPPYKRFKVNSLKQVQEALEVILGAPRKR